MQLLESKNKTRDGFLRRLRLQRVWSALIFTETQKNKPWLHKKLIKAPQATQQAQLEAPAWSTAPQRAALAQQPLLPPEAAVIAITVA